MKAQSASTTSRQILAVAAPAFAALIAEPLMLLADTAIIGHLGTAELAGLAVAAIVLGTEVGLCIFLAYGTTATVSRSHGAGRDDEAMSQALGGLWLALVLGIVIALATALLATPLTHALASSAAVADHARTYLLISTLGIPAVLLGLAATGALRGVLDLRTPLVITVISCLANVVLNMLLVYGAGLGVAGAAIGTVIAQWGAATWLVATVVRRAVAAGASAAPRLDPVIEAARTGVPLIVRTATLRASLVLATVVASTFGDAPLAAHQIATTIVLFGAFALDALAIAGQTLTGRALGSGDGDLAAHLTAQMIRWGWGAGVLLGLALAATSGLLPDLFTQDSAVSDALVPALLVIAAIQPISGAVFVLDGVLIGAGDGRYLAWAGLLVLAVYAPVALAVAHTDAGLTWLWVAYGVFIAARWATLEMRRRSGRWMVLG